MAKSVTYKLYVKIHSVPSVRVDPAFQINKNFNL